MVKHTSIKSNTIRNNLRYDMNKEHEFYASKEEYNCEDEYNSMFEKKRNSKPVRYLIPGKYLARISLITGILALIFVLLPIFFQSFVVVFWLFTFLGMISVCTSIVAFCYRRFLLPLLGFLFSVAAFITAVVCAPIYAVSVASSVNSFMNLLKTFIDALIWPF